MPSNDYEIGQHVRHKTHGEAEIVGIKDGFLKVYIKHPTCPRFDNWENLSGTKRGPPLNIEIPIDYAPEVLEIIENK
jgi:hypothetical protein